MFGEESLDATVGEEDRYILGCVLHLPGLS